MRIGTPRWYVRLAILPLASAALHISLAHAQALPCTSKNEDSRCVWTFYGEPVPDSKERREDETIRVIGTVALRQGMSVMVEFRRDLNGETWMTFRDPYSSRGRIQIIVPPSAWTETLARWKNFQDTQEKFQVRHARDLAKREKSGETVVCTDGADVSVDTELDGKTKHLETDDCENNVVDDFIDDIRNLCYAQLPYCADKTLQWAQLCLALDGDKFAATAAVKRAMKIDTGGCNKNEPSLAVSPLLADGAVLRIAGVPDVKGRAAVSAAWQEYVCALLWPLGPWPDSAQGSENAVLITGLIAATAKEATTGPPPTRDIFRHIRSSQTWVRSSNGDYLISEWNIERPIDRAEP